MAPAASPKSASILAVDDAAANAVGRRFRDRGLEFQGRLQQLRATLRFKPLWIEDLAGLARDLFKVTS